jgi:poly-gamma-glutamate synthesis protein (capsule biosynthesis protein)
MVANLECCISDRGTPWPDPGKPFFFRAPPVAVEALSHVGVDCVTLANNHALDFGEEALLDTFGHLEAAGIAWVGAGSDIGSARRPAVLEAGGSTVAVVGLTDHPVAFAAGDGPGVAYADLRSGTPAWVSASMASVDAEVVVVTPHWGPNMTTRPLPHVLRAADDLVAAGATAVAGHSAHVFHGVRDRVLFDLGDFVDDYAVDPVLRNDLGLLWRATFEDGALRRVEGLPLRLEYCFTRPADGDEAAWIARRLRSACMEFGTEVTARDGLFTIEVP